MNEIVDIKNEFMTTIRTLMSNRGFKEIENGYEKIDQHKLPDQYININGRNMVSNGGMVTLKTSVIFNGDGWISNKGDTNQRQFSQIRFKIEQNEDTRLDHEECFYWDEIEKFKIIFNEIIK